MDNSATAHEDDSAPVAPGPGPRWSGDGALAPKRAPRWGAEGAAPLQGGSPGRTADVSAPPLAPRQPTVDGMLLASAFRRLTAWVLDRLVKSVIFLAVLTITGAEVPEVPWAVPELIVASALLNAGYDFIFGIQGVTPAGYLLRIRIAAVDGSEPGVRRALVRAAGASINETFLWVGSLWLFFDARRQTFHDKLAGTIVVRRPAPDAGPEEGR